ncbi:Protein CIP2A [Lamellibrachia satsuma]|nr:Protein CIP2A [Lamellibrachia satsuma]
METTSCVKAVVLSANQYRNNQSETNLVHLQRDLDVLISISSSQASLGFFDPRKLLPTECLSSLVSVLNDGRSKPALAHKVMILLNNLACSDAVRDSLHRSFHLTACLATFLRTQAISPVDAITLQCVQLLQRVTYKCKVSAQESYVDDLLQFLIKHTQGKETELTKACLGVLANLCQENFSVQTHMKSLENVKPFLKSLVSYLSHRDQMMVMFALCLLTSLCIHEDLGQRLFSDSNINQTLQFMFHILVNGDSVMSRRYTADLFIDLVRHAKIQQPLASYDHLHTCLRQILPLLCSHDAESVSKICELLLAFCAVDKLRGAICETFFESATPEQSVTCSVEMKTPFHAALHWASQTTDELAIISPTLLALDFLHQMFEEALDVGLRSTAVQCTSLILPVLVKTLTAFPNNQHGPPTTSKCQKAVKTLQLLTDILSLVI